MVADVALYTLIHQPRRLKLPAQPIPRGASLEDLTRCLFDERLDKRYFHQVASSCYYPAARLLLEMVRQRGLRLALGFTLSFVRQAELWEPALLDLFRELVAEEGVEIVGAEPYHSLHCLIDLPAFTMRMRWMAESLEKTFGKRPTVTDTTEMCMSASIYDALDAAGFRGAFLAHDPRVMQWRSSNYVYRSADEQPYPLEFNVPTRARRSTAKISERDRLGPPYTSETLNTSGPCLLVRHQVLSDDVGLRFSNSSWSGYPLYAETYARWIAGAEGDFVLLGWDFETFGERHTPDSGIFEFMRALPGELERQGVALRTPGELIDRYAETRAYPLSLPLRPISWLDALGLDSSAGYGPQQELFQLMCDVYNLARLTENPELLDLAIWLAQTDHFRLLRWPGPQLVESITPPEWQRLGVSALLNERKQLYFNVLGALAPYLPARILRQAGQQLSTRTVPDQGVSEEPTEEEVTQKPTPKTTRRKSVAKEPEEGQKPAAKTTRRKNVAEVPEAEVAQKPTTKTTRRKIVAEQPEAGRKPQTRTTRRKSSAEEPGEAQEPPPKPTRRRMVPKDLEAAAPVRRR